MARTLDKPRAIAEGLGEWQEQLEEAIIYVYCTCCCCTGECSYYYSELEEIEEKVFYGELDAWPF